MLALQIAFGKGWAGTIIIAILIAILIVPRCSQHTPYHQALGIVATETVMALRPRCGVASKNKPQRSVQNDRTGLIPGECGLFGVRGHGRNKRVAVCDLTDRQRVDIMAALDKLKGRATLTQAADQYVCVLDTLPGEGASKESGWYSKLGGLRNPRPSCPAVASRRRRMWAGRFRLVAWTAGPPPFQSPNRARRVRGASRGSPPRLFITLE